MNFHTPSPPLFLHVRDVRWRFLIFVPLLRIASFRIRQVRFPSSIYFHKLEHRANEDCGRLSGLENLLLVFPLRETVLSSLDYIEIIRRGICSSKIEAHANCREIRFAFSATMQIIFLHSLNETKQRSLRRIMAENIAKKR